MRQKKRQKNLQPKLGDLLSLRRSSIVESTFYDSTP